MVYTMCIYNSAKRQYVTIPLNLYVQYLIDDSAKHFPRSVEYNG